MQAEVLGDEFFGPWEGDVIASWKEALAAIDDIIRTVGERSMAWRGQVNSTWNLHSSLYRRAIAISSGSTAPMEKELFELEKRVEDFTRTRWRFNNRAYLEMLAHLQHYRAPTRMLDVSLNPLVALWFAVEQQFDAHDGADGRIFAFDVSKNHRDVVLDEKWGGYSCPWDDEPPESKWSTQPPLFWRPPSYNERIPAQQSGFLLAGVPKAWAGPRGAKPYRKGPGSSTGFWPMKVVRAATSVPVQMVARDRSAHLRSEPTLTLRVAASAKSEIRARLETQYGINPATMYPDLFGMAEQTKKVVEHDQL